MAWSIVTVEGSYAVRYYAAMCDAAMRIHVTDRLLYAGSCMLGSQGITDYDLMSIGSDFAPSLKGLNEFKTKFTETITPVAPARDMLLKKVFYKTLQAVQGVRRAFRHKPRSGLFVQLLAHYSGDAIGSHRHAVQRIGD